VCLLCIHFSYKSCRDDDDDDDDESSDLNGKSGKMKEGNYLKYDPAFIWTK